MRAAHEGNMYVGSNQGAHEGDMQPWEQLTKVICR